MSFTVPAVQQDYEKTVEAEAADTIVSPMYVGDKDGVYNIKSSLDNVGHALYNFTIPDGFSFNLQIMSRNLCDASDQNSVFFKFYKASPVWESAEEIYGMKVKSSWDWDWVKSTSADPYIIGLTAGTYTFKVRSRQKKARMDKWVFRFIFVSYDGGSSCSCGGGGCGCGGGGILVA